MNIGLTRLAALQIAAAGDDLLVEIFPPAKTGSAWGYQVKNGSQVLLQESHLRERSDAMQAIEVVLNAAVDESGNGKYVDDITATDVAALLLVLEQQDRAEVRHL